MRSMWLVLAIGLLPLASSAAQPPFHPTNPGEPVSTTSPSPAQEIQDLKATLKTLQLRLDRLNAAQVDTSGPTGLESRTSFASSQHSPARVNSPWSPESATFRPEWDNGFYISSEDQRFRMHLGGRILFDTGWNAASQAVQFGPGGIGNLEDGSVFRRARIRTDGTIFGHLDWVAEFDFSNSVENDTSASPQTIGTPSFTNVWLGVNDLPLVGSLRAGWLKEPLGMANSTSSRWLPFMERQPANGLFISPGVMILNHNAQETLTLAAGVFHAQNDNYGFGYGDGEYAYTGRVTGLLWYENDGEQLCHVGISGTHRSLSQGQIRLRGRPSVRTMPSTTQPSLADTGTINGSYGDILGVEWAAVRGPWTMQAECYGAWIHDAVIDQPLGTLYYQGAYFQVLYFLTGEHQSYDRKTGVFDRVTPLSNFNIWEGPHGWGAWQVGIRYAYADLQNKSVKGATLNDFTLGLNWFLNPLTAVQWNLAVDHRDSTPAGSSGWSTVFGVRLALDF